MRPSQRKFTYQPHASSSASPALLDVAADVGPNVLKLNAPAEVVQLYTQDAGAFEEDDNVQENGNPSEDDDEYDDDEEDYDDNDMQVD
jgi:hypothetical protein